MFCLFLRLKLTHDTIPMRRITAPMIGVSSFYRLRTDPQSDSKFLKAHISVLDSPLPTDMSVPGFAASLDHNLINIQLVCAETCLR